MLQSNEMAILASEWQQQEPFAMEQKKGDYRGKLHSKEQAPQIIRSSQGFFQTTLLTC